MNRKATFLLSLLFGLSTWLIGQKHDYHWVIGYGSNPFGTDAGGTNISFHSDPPDTSYVFRDMDQGPFNNNISDQEGNLLFYSNGCEIAGKDNLPLLNGDSINTGSIFESFCDLDYPLTQGGLILPGFQNKDIYHFLHLHLETDTQFGFIVDGLWYSQIDMQKDNGHGAVIIKNQPLETDTFWLGQLTATKHGNGRDWWIMLPAFGTNKYTTLLFTENGIHQKIIQDFEQQLIPNETGQAVFSPDGSKYIRFDPDNELQIYDFDRCNGELSNPQIIDLDYDPNLVVAGGVAVSPNSRYLYVSATIYAYQFDLQAADIADSEIFLGEFDGYQSPFGSTFFMSQLCPDGKIYMNTTNGENVLHVIHKPNIGGTACDFEQHGFHLPTYNGLSIPNFPNYNLGALVDSSCDSLFVNAIELEAPKLEHSLSPNPAIDQTTISFSSPLIEEIEFTLINIAGRPVAKLFLRAGTLQEKIELTHLPNGHYFYELSNGRQQRLFGRLIINK